MKKLITLLSFLILTVSLQAQDCYRAAWGKAFGGASAYNSIVDGARRSDGTFSVCGSFGSADMVLGTVIVADSGFYNWFVASHDSAGNFFNGKLVAWYSSSGDACQIKKIDVGVDNSVCITGYWLGSTVRIADSLLPSCTRNRVFVAKFDANLNHQWTRLSDWMSADCQANDVTTDLNKNVYICGSYEDDAFRIGGFTVENYGGWNLWRDDAFIIKFDSSGNTKFLKSIGTPNDESASVIVADSAGNFYVAGSTSASATSYFKFDNQIACLGGVSSYNMFYAKYSGTDGHCLWGKIASGYNTSDRLYPYDACLGENNCLILGGTLTGQVQFAPYTYIADGNGFVAKVDANGNNLWLSNIGGQNSSEYTYHVSYYGGKIATSGVLYSNQPYVGDFPLYSTQSGGSFIAYNAMLTTDGKTLWARGNNVGGSTYYNSAALIDNSGNQLLWGSFKSTQTWYPVSMTNSLSNYKLFLIRFQPFSPPSAFTVSAGPDKITSCGTSVQLSGSTTPAGIPFGWWPNLGFTGNGTKTPTVNPGINTTYYLYASYQGCVNRDTVTVTYSNHAVDVNAGTDIDFCAGDSVRILSTCNQPTATYTWLPAKYINTSTSLQPWVKPPQITQYTVTATYGGCVDIDTISVNSRPKPYIYLPKQDLYYSWWRTHLCADDSLDINFGDSANTYTVTTPTIVTNVNNNLATLLPISAILRVTATSPYGCTNKDSVSVIVHNNQAAPPVEGHVNDRSVCPGDSVNLQVYFTSSLHYNFQYSWYGGWQVDSLNGHGWQDINYWDHNFDIFLYSYGDPTYYNYSTLRIFTVNADMDGFKYRPYIYDYCSPRGYGNAATLHVGPKITLQPLSENFCQGATDSIACNSSSVSTSYSWEIKQGGVFVPFVDQPGVMTTNGRFFKIINASPSIDSTFIRCKINGCAPASDVYTDSALIRVINVPANILSYYVPADSICANDTSYLNVIVDNPQFYTFTWYENNVALTYSTSQRWGYNTSTLHFTPVLLMNNNYTYKCKITNTQCVSTTYSPDVRFYVKTPPTVTWPGGNAYACNNAGMVPISGATPAGGTYTGAHVVGGAWFDPTGLSAGNYPVTYSYTDPVTGCHNSVSKNFSVTNPPTVSWTGATVTCCVTQSYSTSLSGGSPWGGTYAGPGVSGSYFYPPTAGIGSHQLMYIYTSPTTGCIDTAYRTYNVVAAPSVTWPGGTVTYCLNDPAFTLSGGLPGGGSYSGTGVSGGTFNPASAGTGSHSITYFYMDGNNCTGTAQRNFIVDACTGLTQLSNSNGLFELYPNPAKNEITIRINGALEEEESISITNALGEEVLQQRATKTDKTVVLHIETLPAGLYIVKFMGFTAKFVKQN